MQRKALDLPGTAEDSAARLRPRHAEASPGVDRALKNPTADNRGGSSTEQHPTREQTSHDPSPVSHL